MDFFQYTFVWLGTACPIMLLANVFATIAKAYHAGFQKPKTFNDRLWMFS